MEMKINKENSHHQCAVQTGLCLAGFPKEYDVDGIRPAQC
jgi:hypothetical protein